jgi:hypothetical protein
MKRLLLEIKKMKLLVQEPDKLKKRVNQSKKTPIVAVRKSSRLKNKINFFFNFIQFIFTVRRIFNNIFYQHISTLSINSNNKIFTFIACYFPYDNGSALNFSEFQSCLQVINELFCFF